MAETPVTAEEILLKYSPFLTLSVGNPKVKLAMEEYARIFALEALEEQVKEIKEVNGFNRIEKKSVDFCINILTKKIEELK
jgi:uncharacterized membrane protein